LRSPLARVTLLYPQGIDEAPRRIACTLKQLLSCPTTCFFCHPSFVAVMPNSSSFCSSFDAVLRVYLHTSDIRHQGCHSLIHASIHHSFICSNKCLPEGQVHTVLSTVSAAVLSTVLPAQNTKARACCTAFASIGVPSCTVAPQTLWRCRRHHGRVVSVPHSCVE